jgi:hypothetical protein
MGFIITSDELGRSQIVPVDEPSWIVPLPIAPPSIEDGLRRGRWLVVSMSVWSMHDMRAGHRAIEIVNRRGGLLNLGLRPFDYPQEHAAWVPDFDATLIEDQAEIVASEQHDLREVVITGRADASPMWVTLLDGRVVGLRCGQLSDTEIGELIDHLLAVTS